MNSAPRLCMRAITKAYGGIAALSDGSLDLLPGEVHALMGANGAGKSTLSNVLGGVVTQDTGTIEIDGEQVEIGSASRAKSLGIAFVHQELTTMPTLSVAENIFLGDYPKVGPFIARRRMEAEAAELLKQINGVSGAVTIEKDVKLQINVAAQTAEKAKEYATQAEQGLKIATFMLGNQANNDAKLQPLADAAATLRATADGEILTIRGELSFDNIQKLIKSFGNQ